MITPFGEQIVLDNSKKDFFFFFEILQKQKDRSIFDSIFVIILSVIVGNFSYSGVELLYISNMFWNLKEKVITLDYVRKSKLLYFHVSVRFYYSALHVYMCEYF